MDVIELDRRAARGMTAVLAGTSNGSYGGATPCAPWSVWDLVVHVVAGNVKYTEIARGGDWARGVPEVDVGDDPLGTYRESVETMLEAWQRPGALDREIDLPRGRGRAEAALYVHLGETLVHGWDLAKATGQWLIVDDDVVEASLAQYQSWLPPQRPPEVPFSDASPVGANALRSIASPLTSDATSAPGPVDRGPGQRRLSIGLAAGSTRCSGCGPRS